MNVNLFQGDCLEIMKDIPDGSVDCVIIDPPYGTSDAKWDIAPLLGKLFSKLFRVLKHNGALICFAQMPFGVDVINASRKQFRYELIWKKNRATGFLNANKMPLRAHENILVFYRKIPTFNKQLLPGEPYNRKSYRGSCLYSNHKTWVTINNGTRNPIDVLEFKSSNTKYKHPTQKPIELIEWLVKTYSNQGETVLDCYMGSGTTGAACVRNNRNFIGMELDKKYFEIAKHRIEDEIKKAENQPECEPFWNLTTGEFNVGGFYCAGNDVL